VGRVTLFDMTATVLEPPLELSEPALMAGTARYHMGVCDPDQPVLPADATDQPLAYSDIADEWYWVPVDNVGTADRRGRTVPADVFLMVQAILLIEAVLAIANLQGDAWHPVAVVVIILLVVALSANFVAGVAAARAGRASPGDDNGERGRWYIAGLLPQ
jgi:hypothetical protein